VTFLSKAERDYLLSSGEQIISPGYNRVIRSRLHKKVQQFVSQELPILVQNGYYVPSPVVIEFRNATENSNVEPTCPFGHGRFSNDIIENVSTNILRGSPSLVGRGIANPMSERTRGFEILPSLPSLGVREREGDTKIPLPALLVFSKSQCVEVLHIIHVCKSVQTMQSATFTPASSSIRYSLGSIITLFAIQL
jgi:hypothetical protein